MQEVYEDDPCLAWTRASVMTNKGASMMKYEAVLKKYEGGSTLK